MRKSPVDTRDYKASSYINFNIPLPNEYRAPKTVVRWQGMSSQCVSYACTQAYSQQEAVDKGAYQVYSSSWLYGNRDNIDLQEDGWYIREALKSMQKYGLVPEFLFYDYNENYMECKIRIKEKEDYLKKMAKVHTVDTYFKCETEEEIKRTIMTYGAVITSCSFYDKNIFIRHRIHKPKEGAKPHGGHAFILIGWDDKGWIAQDSYGYIRPWLGRFHIDYDFPLDEYWGIIIS